ncbi:MAG TPA: hypothetical protein VNK95_24570, partial [Caldilineaceae bacterium]|nr:hypothetical protein [Caldilineaceae bacterium]
NESGNRNGMPAIPSPAPSATGFTALEPTATGAAATAPATPALDSPPADVPPAVAVLATTPAPMPPETPYPTPQPVNRATMDIGPEHPSEGQTAWPPLLLVGFLLGFVAALTIFIMGYLGLLGLIYLARQ